jgi:hypothetical protein
MVEQVLIAPREALRDWTEVLRSLRPVKVATPFVRETEVVPLKAKATTFPEQEAPS